MRHVVAASQLIKPGQDLGELRRLAIGHVLLRNGELAGIAGPTAQQLDLLPEVQLWMLRSTSGLRNTEPGSRRACSKSIGSSMLDMGDSSAGPLLCPG